MPLIKETKYKEDLVCLKRIHNLRSKKSKCHTVWDDTGIDFSQAIQNPWLYVKYFDDIYSSSFC